MTKFQVMLLLYISIYESADDVHARFSGEAIETELDVLLGYGFIDRVDYPLVTNKGKAYIGMLLQTPEPNQVFINPITKERINF